MFVFAAAAFAVAPPTVDDPLVTKAKARKDVAVVIGVEDYTDLPDATGATLDAKAAETLFSSTLGVKDVRYVDEPDAAGITAAVADAAKACRHGRLWIYFSGQGGIDANAKRTLLGKDGEAVLVDDLVATATASKAKSAVLVLDAGFGGLGRAGEAIGARKNPASLQQPASEKVTVWTAATGGDPAFYYPAATHGLFTWLVVGGMRGWADGATGGTRNGEVTLEEAQTFVDKQERALGGRSTNPVKDLREDPMKWVLVKGATEEGPSADDWTALAAAEKTRRMTEAQKKVMAEATAKWKDVDAATTTAGPATDTALKAFIEQYDDATVTVDGVTVAVDVPEVATARQRLDDYARAAAKAAGKKRRRRSKTPPPPPPPPPPTAEVAACIDLVKLEPVAMTGGLSDDQVSCLEKRIVIESKQTTRDKVSRVLLQNADGKGDVTEWMRLAARHLDEIDRSDPDLCYRYALQLSRNGEVQDMDDVVTWVDYALENKQRWQGALYKSRVYNLYRLRAETSMRMWRDADDAYVSERTDENEAESERLRGVAKSSAKEWLDYARLSAQPTDRAEVLCESSSGSPDYCQTKPESDAGDSGGGAESQ